MRATLVVNKKKAWALWAQGFQVLALITSQGPPFQPCGRCFFFFFGRRSWQAGACGGRMMRYSFVGCQSSLSAKCQGKDGRTHIRPPNSTKTRKATRAFARLDVTISSVTFVFFIFFYLLLVLLLF